MDSVIRAFGLVQDRIPDASLEIAGTGSEERRLRELVAKAGLKNVRFRGYVPRAGIARALRAVRTFCLTDPMWITSLAR